MNAIKRILSLILAVLAISLPSAVFAAEGENLRFAEVNELLVGIGFEDVSDNLKKNISRGDFVDLLAKNSYYEQIEKAKLPMIGVFADTNYYFLPENQISLRDALMLCVKLLTFSNTDVNEAQLLQYATRLSLFDGLGTDFSKPLTYESAYILLYNYLTADVSLVGKIFHTSGTTLLNDKYGISVINGFVDGAGYLSFNKGEYFGKISIDNTSYICERYGEELFGRYIKAYVQENDNEYPKVIAAVVQSKTTVTEIYPSNDPVFQNNFIVYYGNGTNELKIQISQKSDMFYNGTEFSFDSILAVPESGKITVIDNGIYSDGADVVIIEGALTSKVSAVNKSTNTVYVSGTGYVFDENVKIQADTGEILKFSDIKTGDIVSMYASQDKSLYKCIKLSETVSGVLEEVSGSTITINGSSYKATNLVQSEISTFVGKRIKVALDICRNAAYIMDTDAAALKIGVLMSGIYQNEGLSESIQVKIFDEKGKINIYEVSDRTSISGRAYNGYDRVYAALPKVGKNIKQSIVIFEFGSDGKINSIDFPSNKIMDIDGGSKIYKTSEDNLSEQEYVAYAKFQETLGMQVFITPDTKVFKIPAQGEDGSISDDDNMYSTFVCSSLTSGTQFYMPSVGYTTDKNSKVADYAVLSYDVSNGGEEATIDSNTRVSMVERISKIILGSGEVVEAARIYTMKYPGGVTVYGKSDNYFTSRNIAAGDLIRCDFQNETLSVNAVERVYKKGAQTLVNGAYLHNGESSGEGKISEVRLCKVYRRWGDVADLVYANQDMENIADENIKCVKTSLYIIFKFDEKTQKVKAMTQEDLFSYDNMGDDCSQIVFDDRWNAPYSMFIIK